MTAGADLSLFMVRQLWWSVQAWGDRCFSQEKNLVRVSCCGLHRIYNVIILKGKHFWVFGFVCVFRVQMQVMLHVESLSGWIRRAELLLFSLDALSGQRLDHSVRLSPGAMFPFGPKCSHLDLNCQTLAWHLFASLKRLSAASVSSGCGKVQCWALELLCVSSSHLEMHADMSLSLFWIFVEVNAK